MRHAFSAVLLSLVFSSPAIGDGNDRYFDSPWIGYDTGPWPEGIYPYDAAVGDFNDDDVPDLATVNFLVGWPGLSILLGDGNGGYLPPVVYELAVESAGVSALDWDNDGDLDLAVSDTDRFFGGFTISIWENGGAGEFVLFDSFLMGDHGPAGLTAADFDGDGWTDLACANDANIECNNTVSVLFNQNGAGFSEPGVYQVSGCTSEIASGDVNGDGHADLVVGHRSNRWTLLLNDQNGSFIHEGFRTGIDSGNLPENPAIHLADIDLDGDLDVFYSHSDSGGAGQGAIGLWRNDGSGSFGAAETMSFNRHNHGGVDIATGDVTDDGWPDVLAVAGGEGNWFLFESDGDGRFLPARRLRAGHAPNAVRLSDLDADGDLDVTILAALSLEACVYLNPGDGSFVQPAPIDFVDPALSPAFTTNVEAGDIDLDDDLDLVVGFRSDFNSAHGITVRRNNGDGTFGPRETYSDSAYPAWVQLADMDNDADLDILYFDADTYFYLRKNDGSGNFGPRLRKHQFSLSPENKQIDAVDVDQDGDLDVCMNTGFFFRVSRNLGNDNYGAPYIAADLGAFTECFAFGDYNEDNRIDLLTSGGSQEARVLICFGNGDGTFQPPNNIGVAERDVHSIGVADLDHDGHLDLTAISDRTPKQLTIRRGRGDGNFFLMEAHHTSFFFNQYTPGGTTELVDIDRDGFEDILFANTFAQDFSFWKNNGDGTFQEMVRYGAGHDVHDMAVGDFNGDGLIDVAMAAEIDDGRWFYTGVVIVEGVGETIGGPAILTGLEMRTGTLLGGEVADLEASDDTFLHTRSGFGTTFTDLHHMDLLVSAVTAADAATLLDLTIESRIDEPAGTARIRLRNWNTNQFDQVGAFPLNQSDTVRVINDIDAADYVSDGGEIDLSIKHIVFAPIFAFRFDSFIDEVRLEVQEGP